MPENLRGSHAGINLLPTENVAVVPRQANPVHGKPLEVFQIFLKIGLTAFGGPIAHLGYFEREIIERRKWWLSHWATFVPGSGGRLLRLQALLCLQRS